MRRRSEKNKQLVSQEVALGKRLFESRGKRSEISGNPLGYEYDHVFASHVLPKGAYPKFRLYNKNIVLMSFEEHRAWEHYRHTIKDRPEWAWVFILHEFLLREYYQKKI
jgi:hypothetical protein